MQARERQSIQWQIKNNINFEIRNEITATTSKRKIAMKIPTESKMYFLSEFNLDDFRMKKKFFKSNFNYQNFKYEKKKKNPLWYFLYCFLKGLGC